MACTKHAPCGVRRVARRVRCILLRTTCDADVRTLCVLSCVWMTASSYFFFSGGGRWEEGGGGDDDDDCNDGDDDGD